MPKTHEEWRAHILDDLGNDGLDIELTERQLDTALRRSIQLFNRYKPHVRWLNLGEVTGVGTTYFELTETDVGEIGVLDVEFADRTPYGPIVPLVGSTLTLRWGRRGPRIFFQRTVDQRRMERFTGTQPSWWWDSEENILYVTAPDRQVKVMALFTLSRHPWGEDIRFDEEHQFEDLAVAYAKILVADILQQAGDTIPGPQGEIGSNADQWRTEGNETIERIRTELANSVRGVPPPHWVG
jgi:hypothetical protein